MLRSLPAQRRLRLRPGSLSTVIGTAVLVVLGVSVAAGAQQVTRRVDNARIEVETGTARAVYRPGFEKPGANSPDDVARAFLRSDRRIAWSGDDTQLRLSGRATSRGGSHLTYRQFVGDVPVLDSETRVSVDQESKVTFVLNGLRPALADAPELQPAVSQSDAESMAAAAVQRGDAAVSSAELGILPGPPARLVWTTFVWPEQGGEWRVRIDAGTGGTVEVENRLLHRSTVSPVVSPGRVVRRIEPGKEFSTAASTSSSSAVGQGMVFDPDPLATSGRPYAPPYTDADDAEIQELNAERIQVDLLDISLFADDKYRLVGPHVEVTGVRPSGLSNYDPPVESDAASFLYTRGDERFEAVMSYYHIDKSQRHVQELGFEDLQNQPIPVNPFGEGNQDISNYYYERNFIALGGGAIDDAEDAFVIWHEYAHALLHQRAPGVLNQREGQAIHEGWADYWAASYQREMFEQGLLPAGDFRRLFRWDGNATRWQGRQMPEFARYPEDLPGTSVHEDGLVYASALMGVWDFLGRRLTDELTLQSHFYLGQNVTMPDMAEAFVQADIDLYGGQHAADIIAVFAERGLVDPDSYEAVIDHEPITDTEQVGGSVEVIATVTGLVSPIQSVMLHYEIDGSETVAPMTAIGDNNYSAEIALPSSPAIVEYYVVSVDESGSEVTYPDGAPSSVIRFQAGPDNQGPEIQHIPITQVSLLGWPPIVTATITDNIGVDSAVVEFTVFEAPVVVVTSGRFTLVRTGDAFSAPFPNLENQLDGDESIAYRIIAVDRSTAANETSMPPAAEQAYEFVVSALGTVASYDFEGVSDNVSTTGVWEHGTPAFGVHYAHSGSDTWATSLDSAYPDFPGRAELVLPSTNLSGLASAWLEFWHWYDIEHDGTAVPGTEIEALLWDGAVVQVSTDGGTTWTSIVPEGGYDGTIPDGAGNPLANEEAFGGYSYGWRREVAQIPAGPDVQVRFNFGHDVSNDEYGVSLAGWIVDDVSIRVDRPTDVEAPVITEGPPVSTEAEAGSPVGPEVSIRASDNVGIADVNVSYELIGGGFASGTVKLAQSPTDPELFSGRIPITGSAAVPGSVVEYQISVTDFDGNLTAASGGPFAVEYVFVAREDPLVGLTPTGGWEAEQSGWRVSDNSLTSTAASLVLSPTDLPSDAADLRFELSHDYDVTPPTKARVSITANEGREWVIMDPNGGYPTSGSGFQGRESDAFSVFDLNAYSGMQVQLRIDLETEAALADGDFWMVKAASTVFKADGDRFSIPRSLELHANFPDPFSEHTSISYTVPESSVVELAAYDILGRRVAQILSEQKDAGTYTIRWNGSGLAAGTYFVRIQTDSGMAVESVSIIR